MPIRQARFRSGQAGSSASRFGRDRGIIGALARGERTFSVEDRLGITAGRVLQLRRRYEREWRVLQGEAA